MLAKTPGTYASLNANRVKVQNTVRARHETVNKRFKALERFNSVMEAIVFLTQLTIECGEPLFSVDYDDDFT